MLLETVDERAPGAPGAKVAVASSGDPTRRERILLVDDQAELRRLYESVLSAYGFQVDTAEDGEAGWARLRAESFLPDGYDLLITDNSMPKLSGVDLIKKVRSAGLELPIILASGNTPEDTESLRLAAVLAKPFTMTELLRAVTGVLHKAAHFG